MTTELCVSVNFFTSTRECEMKTADQELITGEFEDDIDSIHYSSLLCS